jgi:hypothetical protein
MYVIADAYFLRVRFLKHYSGPELSHLIPVLRIRILGSGAFLTPVRDP